MWARHPRNFPPTPFTSDVMRDKSDRVINPEIGNSYLLSGARPKSCKKRRRRVIDQYMHSLTCLLQTTSSIIFNVCFVYITIASNVGRASDNR